MRYCSAVHGRAGHLRGDVRSDSAIIRELREGILAIQHGSQVGFRKLRTLP